MLCLMRCDWKQTVCVVMTNKMTGWTGLDRGEGYTSSCCTHMKGLLLCPIYFENGVEDPLHQMFISSNLAKL